MRPANASARLASAARRPSSSSFTTFDRASRVKTDEGEPSRDVERADAEEEHKYDRSRRERRRGRAALARAFACQPMHRKALVVLTFVFMIVRHRMFVARARERDVEELRLGERTSAGDRATRAEASDERELSERMKPLARKASELSSKEKAMFANATSTPKLVPRLVHQTYKSRKALTERDRASMKTWSDANPGWEMRFYDDEDCKRFVSEHFPDYYQAYASLEKKVEQSDFFRYLVVLKFGGVYADVDTECRRPLDDFIHAKDTLIVGWENEFFTDSQAYSRHFVRRRQVLNWAFAGAPGHPVLVAVAEHINQGSRKVFSGSTNRNTLERTGPGAFTDALMDHFEKLRAGEGNAFWNVRALPKVNFGTHPLGEEGVSQDHPDVVIAHRYSGGWKDKSGWNGKRRWYEHLAVLFHSLKSDLPEYREKIAARDEHFQMPAVDPAKMYPVSAIWKPNFDLMTPLVGTSKDDSVTDEGHWLTLYGRPKLTTLVPLRGGETPADMLLLGLSRRAATAGAGNKGIFVDVGAGFGYYTVAMASRAHDVYAYEWDATMASNTRAAIAYNGLSDSARVATDRSTLENGEELKALAERIGKIDALRIAGRGLDGVLLEGAKTLLSGARRPGVVLLEISAKRLASSGNSTERFNVETFEFMWNAGYTDVGHVGPSCDGRGVRTLKANEESAFAGKAWCRIDISSINRVISAMDDQELEIIVLFHNGATSKEVDSVI